MDISYTQFSAFVKYLHNRTAHTVFVNDEMGMVWMATVMTYFKILCDWSD
jgi:hypothetical protein